MWIEQVRLYNIKSYQDCTLRLHRGVNFISGRNGAGKSTLIEAIGFALFDAMEGTYAQLLRWGAKSGGVEVCFHCGQGSYRVVRKLTPKGSGTWQAFEMESGMALNLYADADVRAWLTETLHLQVGASLPEHFSELVAVRQGTFVAPFLLAPARRKAYFDPLFDVDAFKRGGERARSAERALEDRAAQTELSHMQAHTRSEGIENTERLFESAQQSLQADREANAQAAQAYAMLAEAWQQRLVLSKREAELNAAIAEQERALREGEQRLTQGQTLCAQQTAQAQEDAQGLAASQQATETAGAALANRIVQAERVQVWHRRTTDRIDALERLSLRQVAAQRELTQLEAELLEEPTLRQHEERAQALESSLQDLRAKLAAVRAQLEALERNRSQAGDGLCPFLNQPCRNVEGGLPAYFDEACAQMQAQLQAVTAQGKAEKAELDALAPHRKRLQECAKRRATHEARTADLLALEGEAKTLCADLLADPPAHNGITGCADVSSGLGEAWAHVAEAWDVFDEASPLALLSRTVKEQSTLVQTLQEQLERARKEQQQAERTLEGLRAKARGSREALSLAEQQQAAFAQEHQRAGARLEALCVERVDVQKRLADLCAQQATGDAAEVTEQTLREAAQQAANAQAKLEKTEAEIARLSETLRDQRTALAQAEEFKRKLEELRQGLAVMRLLRDVLGGSGERIATLLRGRLAMEAERLYMRIAHESVTLAWSDGYEIQLIDQQGGRERCRSFAQLSGGERMSAALAIRLALLLQFSPLRFACFDEPTDALDTERRANLAQVLPELTAQWDQVLMISHDDAFDAITENALQLEPSQDGTKVRT